jgi:hypothetical protein
VLIALAAVLLALLLLLVIAPPIFLRYATRMPGQSHRGPLPELDPAEAGLRDRLRAHVEAIAGEIGERHVGLYDKLEETAAYVSAQFAAAGHAVAEQTYEAGGRAVRNLEVEVAGGARAGEIVIVGAHYDTVPGSPGANDNTTGVAGVLELARSFAARWPARTLRLVAFVNEEPPWFQTGLMGSTVYARRCRERGEQVVAMLALETIGYYSDRPGSQSYPPPLARYYPDVGNFIGFVGNMSSGRLASRCVESFRRHAAFPSEGTRAPGWIQGLGWSDHWSFWQAGYPAVMVTDTAPFRYPHYHSPADTPEKVDYDRLARVVAGLEKVIAELAGDASSSADCADERRVPD